MKYMTIYQQRNVQVFDLFTCLFVKLFILTVSNHIKSGHIIICEYNKGLTLLIAYCLIS
jgi:hypothetical protein